MKAAEKQLVSLEMAIPKAHMEAEALRAKAQDLSQRLTELKAATKASNLTCPYIALSPASPGFKLGFEHV